METILYIILGLFVLGFGVIIYLFSKKGKDQNQDQSILMMQAQLKEIRETIDSKLSESHRTIQLQHDQTTKIVKDVTEKLTKLDETNRQVLDFSGQLQKLQDTLQNPKHRGILGEYFLDSLLKDVFQPNQYQMQYKFKNGETVDAVIFLGEKIIPIDSKFSLENYNRITEEQDPSRRESLENEFRNDLKKRIDETAKYIRPNEDTMDFAFMFIPAEGIYYDLLVNKVGAVKVNTRSLLEYASREKKVHIVSPTTFYVTLQAVWQGMRAFTIQERTKEILKNVGMLQKHILAYEDYMKRVGSNLSTTVNSYNVAYKELVKIDKDVVKITDGENKIEPLQIDKPAN